MFDNYHENGWGVTDISSIAIAVASVLFHSMCVGAPKSRLVGSCAIPSRTTAASIIRSSAAEYTIPCF